ncbi:dense granule protein GRA5 [Toxoplasma gondii RUB]|uniref:Dense granule protein 5 n=5 Tax=Toxoplasma gondii TaxID=5811 RepID=A0A0F7UV78_TOXGV|nr:dense granule antigen precursor [Toxoplasma gondii]ESS30698.1 dense granule protein GRA5 [Toxoplasma gondii VEG]KFG40148.1 dense granule protein GRA5 [Toxoplasma gondii GAB2-2007-GAL-DOM2]KFG44720.1 dense granule protein GRA5 [Toxoplasma gondii p89]KFG63226.1 dense granule protein GRA5 [Toxoplasma gondii RUB]
MASVKRVVVAVMIVNVLALIFVGVAGSTRDVGSGADDSEGAGGRERQQVQQHEQNEDRSLFERGRAAVTGHPVRTAVGLAAAVVAVVSLLRLLKRRRRRAIQEESKESATAEEEEVAEEE